MKTLIIAEHDNQSLKPETARLVSAATKLGGEIHILVAGENCANVADAAAKLESTAKVLLADGASLGHQLAEEVAALIVTLAGEYSHVLAAATTTGKNIMPGVAALLDVAQISDIIAIEAPNRFVRPVYAGNAIATVESDETQHVITVRTSAFESVVEGNSAPVESVAVPASKDKSTFISAEIAKSERPELTAANVIISGGRGMQNGENFKLLEVIADKLGAAIGASRAAVDAGFVANDMQVGQTGKIVAPDLYIAVGISGAIQHLAGMKDSKVIVAINKDEEAPIFQVADYGLVGDLFDILPELEKAL